jgi:hypothetical protein
LVLVPQTGLELKKGQVGRMNHAKGDENLACGTLLAQSNVERIF